MCSLNELTLSTIHFSNTIFCYHSASSVAPSSNRDLIPLAAWYLLGLSVLTKPSCDNCTTFARRSNECLEAVDGNKCSQFHRVNIQRMSNECCANVVQHLPMNRAIIVRHSCDCRKYVLNTHLV